MPEAKIQHIVSFSSEDQAHRAENLLSGDSCQKWKCAPGEKQASVVFRLEKSTQLSSVDIGNEGSAFIEILVGRSSSDNPQYQVMLVASSFMSPQESRQGQSPNRVRIFDKEKLAPDISAQKWDLIKVVCTQPFNKRASYGLSFIKFHTLAGDVENSKVDANVVTKETGKEVRKTFGGFKLKDESDKRSDFDLGSQMKMAKQDRDNNIASIQQSEERKDVKRRPKSPVSKKSEEKRRKVVDSSSSKSSSSTPSKSNPVKFDALREKKSNDVTKVSTKIKPGNSKNTRKIIKKKKVKRPYDQILNGVIFSISGFQNPLRSEIREKALRMGAQYRKDWSQDSTHLICAFQNTPKFRQVMLAGGKIVRKDWIEDCSSRKRLVSWKKYSMDPNQSSGSSSEEEEDDDDVSEDADQQEEDDPYGASTDEEAGDTEDEIEKIQASKDKSKPVDGGTKDEDPYDASTDDEAQQSDGDGLPYLPDFFNGKLFLLYGDFKPATRKLLRRHIIACAGKICEYMSDDVDYVVTLASWDDNFEQALASNAGLIFVRPNWVYQCGVEQKIVPYQPYVVESA